jgi:release factor glutamine methyltransferase
MLTVLEIIKKTTEFFAAKGIEQPRLNAEQVIGHGLGLKRMQLYLQFERPLTEKELDVIRPLVRRRGLREPLQYIVGETEFHGLKIQVDRRALIPRPETEFLVELIVKRMSAPPKRILDLGTGTGAIALALASQYGDATVVATDVSGDALALAAENGRKNQLESRVQWLPSDWFGAVPDERFDLIVSNPPYLTESETASAAAEVKEFEPVSALTSSGDEGIDDLARIIEGAGRFLAEGALLALETGIHQHAELKQRAERAGLAEIESVQDLTGRDRFIFARAKRS